MVIASPMNNGATRLESGSPWQVVVTAEQCDDGYRCSIFRGTPGARTIARSRWHTDRAWSEAPTGGDGAAERIATDAAHRVCKATRRQATCSVNLHFERHTTAEIESISHISSELSMALARSLGEQRIRTDIEHPHGLLARLRSPGSDAVEGRARALFATPLDELLTSYREQVRAAHANLFGKRVVIFAPLYLTSACMNDCTYCGFRKSLHIRRTRLSVQQALSEARCLAAHGQRTIDLVSGEIPTDPFIDHVCDVCVQILDGSLIRRVNLNLGALSEKQYARLLSAGAMGYHLYQETYDAETYLKVHRAGPKRDMNNRLHSAQRALSAGFEQIGLGILLGLTSVEDDLVRLARHAHMLMGEFPHVRLGFSLPRMQNANQEPGLLDQAHVDDETFIKAFLFLRLEFPAAHMTLTTRESPLIRDRLLSLGVTKLSAGVSTTPGGYGASDAARGARQFSISDQRSLEDLAGHLRRTGLVPTFH